MFRFFRRRRNIEIAQLANDIVKDVHLIGKLRSAYGEFCCLWTMTNLEFSLRRFSDFFEMKRRRARSQRSEFPMARKVIIDCDPGIDDAVALCLALFDPRLEILAITASEGNARADQSTRNLQAIIEQLDPPRYPRLGVAGAPDDPPSHSLDQFHGVDGLGNCNFEVSLLQHQHPSEKVICDVVRANPGDVTLIALGPLTNVARALQRDPELGMLLRDVVVMGGCVDGVGNVTACAEFNMYYDPVAAQAVFDSQTTKTLIPIDITRQVVFSLDLLENFSKELPSRVGQFLAQILPYSFRAHRQRLGLEGICLHDAIALTYVLSPELFTTKEYHGEVATTRGLTRGVTVFDRRDFPQNRPNMDVAVTIDVSEAKSSLVRGLKYAVQES